MGQYSQTHQILSPRVDPLLERANMDEEHKCVEVGLVNNRQFNFPKLTTKYYFDLHIQLTI